MKSLVFPIAISLALLVSFLRADNGVPVFYCAPGSSQPNEVPGSIMTSADFTTFLQTLTQSAPSKTPVNVIKLDMLSKQEVRAAKSEVTTLQNVNVLSSVEDPLTQLTSFLFDSKIDSTVMPATSLDSALDSLASSCKSGNSIVFLTASTQSLPAAAKRRVRRQAESAEDTIARETSIWGDGGCGAVFGIVYYLNQTSGISSDFQDLAVNNASSSFSCLLSNGSAILNLVFYQNNSAEYFQSLQMNFIADQRNWGMPSGTVTTNLDTYTVTFMGNLYNLNTPLGFSFACTRAVFMLTSNTRSNQKLNLYIDEIQLQPYDIDVDNSTTPYVYPFGPANYCQSFFTNGIWMAIMTLVLMFAILAFGVCCLMSVNTMDRFDDPKGKALVIAAEK